MPTWQKNKDRGHAGFTLIELLIVVSMMAILAAIAYPSYINSITKSKRKAAEACLSSYATFMERFYTSNLRYDQDTGGTAIVLPTLDCASNSLTGKDYGYALDATKLAANTYGLTATPIAGGGQAANDSACGTLTLDQTGARGAGGGTDATTVAHCW